MNSETRQVEVGAHRIEVTVFGSGTPAVVIEPGFGGTAASWRAVAESVAEDTTVVTYDRATYSASSRAQDARTPRSPILPLRKRVPCCTEPRFQL
jgi:pimeloyl-ACP methyl ester carboxylesterase